MVNTPWKDRYVTVDGIRTHYLEAGMGPTVVLLHAGEFGGAAELSWERTIPTLAEHYRVLAPDWLGFGHTDKVHDFVSGQARRLEHMRRFLEELAVGQAAFVGNSMGGLLLAKAVARETPLWEAASLVIVSAGGFSPDNDARRTLLSYDLTIERMRDILTVLFADTSFADDEQYVKRRFDMSAVPGAWECQAAARFRSPQAEQRADFGVPDSTEWERIRVPTLFVAGGADRLKQPGYADELASKLPHGRAITYPTCGHAPNIENAEQFNVDLLAFLKTTHTATP